MLFEWECGGIFQVNSKSSVMFLMGHSQPLFLFIFSIQYSSRLKNFYLNSLMIGFEPWTSGEWSNRSANWATMTALKTCFSFSFFRTCQNHKRLPLSADFPDLCPALEAIPNVVAYCGRNNRWRTEKLANKTLARDVETQIYLYARENLAIINIFIKVKF